MVMATATLLRGGGGGDQGLAVPIVPWFWGEVGPPSSCVGTHRLGLSGDGGVPLHQPLASAELGPFLRGDYWWPSPEIKTRAGD